jgi:hypothetical protein
MHFSPQSYCIYTGGEKGEIGVFDLRMMKMSEVRARSAENAQPPSPTHAARLSRGPPPQAYYL